MDAAILESKLSEWCQEFRTIGGEPERLPKFLAQRIVDSGLTTVQDDPNVVQVLIGDGYKKMRITGWNRPIMRLQYEALDGRLGFGLCQTSAVHPDDHGKLAEIMDRLEGVRP